MSTFHFVENSAHFVLKIELLLTVFSNFEGEAALKVWTFCSVSCVFDKKLFMICIQLDKKN